MKTGKYLEKGTSNQLKHSKCSINADSMKTIRFLISRLERNFRSQWEVAVYYKVV